MSRMFAEGQMWPDKFVSCSAEVPPGLLGVVDLCRLGDQMLNIPPCQLRTGARDMKQNIIKRILPSVRVLHRLKPQWKHFNSVWYSEEKPAGSSMWTLVLKKTGGLFYWVYSTLNQAHMQCLYCINAKVLLIHKLLIWDTAILFTASPLHIKAPV